MQAGQPDIGDLIAGKYVVERVLGRGGMGTVYGVMHQLTGKHLALKCLLPTYVGNPSIVERFFREARAAGRIQHRNVIDVFDTGRDGEVLYIVMPLLAGKPLGELLRNPTTTLADVLTVLIRAMEGVQAAHDLGIVHRDLKPGNIFVCPGVSGRLDDPKVLDFGISKLEDELSSPLTRSGVAMGTPFYMPLEQLTGQRDLDRRVDVYALGVILYEAIAGRPPHAADNVALLALSRMHTPPMPLSLLRSDLPPGLDEVVLRALARDRSERFPTVRALSDALAPFVAVSGSLRVSERQRSEGTQADEALPGSSDSAYASAPTAPSYRPLARPPGRELGERSAAPARGPQRSLAPRLRASRMALVAGGLTLAVLGLLASRSAFEATQAPRPRRADEPTPTRVGLAAPGQGQAAAAEAPPLARPPSATAEAPVGGHDAAAPIAPAPVRRAARRVAVAAPRDAQIAPDAAAAVPAVELAAPANSDAAPVARDAASRPGPRVVDDDSRGDSLSVDEF